MKRIELQIQFWRQVFEKLKWRHDKEFPVIQEKVKPFFSFRGVSNKSCKMPSSSLLCSWTTTLRLAATLVLLSQGGETITEDSKQDFYDPWKESDRPKVLVDYHNGPLRGRPFTAIIITCIINEIPLSPESQKPYIESELWFTSRHSIDHLTKTNFSLIVWLFAPMVLFW